ncbi:MAG: hypothetical protein GYA66_09035 [Phyllobacteriaceae bacterium]|nr:hypothetical protein [Phyllobacteriaceae bacterium]
MYLSRPESNFWEWDAMRFAESVVGVALAALACTPAWSADLSASDSCAVSGPNGKIQAEAGSWDDRGVDRESQYQGTASLSMPIGCALGLQLDAGRLSLGAAEALGVGGHIFMRDPQSFLLGLHATYEDWSFDFPATDVVIKRIGAEGELYLGQISLEAWAGLEDTQVTDANLFGKLAAAYYATDDLRLAAGLRQSGGFTSGMVAAEWQVSDTPLSFTAEAEMSEDESTSLKAGVKFYFGAAQKSLISRHREDDPEDGLFHSPGAAAQTAHNEGCLDDVPAEIFCVDEMPIRD